MLFGVKYMNITLSSTKNTGVCRWVRHMTHICARWTHVKLINRALNEARGVHASNTVGNPIAGSEKYDYLAKFFRMYKHEAHDLHHELHAYTSSLNTLNIHCFDMAHNRPRFPIFRVSSLERIWVLFNSYCADGKFGGSQANSQFFSCCFFFLYLYRLFSYCAAYIFRLNGFTQKLENNININKTEPMHRISKVKTGRGKTPLQILLEHSIWNMICVFSSCMSLKNFSRFPLLAYNMTIIPHCAISSGFRTPAQAASQFQIIKIIFNANDREPMETLLTHIIPLTVRMGKKEWEKVFWR